MCQTLKKFWYSELFWRELFWEEQLTVKRYHQSHDNCHQHHSVPHESLWSPSSPTDISPTPAIYLSPCLNIVVWVCVWDSIMLYIYECLCGGYKHIFGLDVQTTIMQKICYFWIFSGLGSRSDTAEVRKDAFLRFGLLFVCFTCRFDSGVFKNSIMKAPKKGQLRLYQVFFKQHA